MFNLPFLKTKYVKPINSENIEYTNLPKEKNHIKSVAIFGCFSGNGKISKLQKYYLEELSKIFDAILMIFDNCLIKDEIKELPKKVIYLKAERHEEYDFGSYKRGYLFLKEHKLIDSLDRLLLINDSSYGPVYPLSEAYNKMDCKTDFWGMVKNDKYDTHIQSWFISFGEKIIKSNLIYEFLKNVKKHKLQQTFVLKYETKFTRFLINNGFTYNAYLPMDFKIKKFMTAGNMCFFAEKLIKDYRIPFMKKKLFDPYFYHIVDERKGALNQIKNVNLKLYNLIIEDLKSKHYDMSFLN